MEPEVDGHYYSVPYQLVGQQVDGRCTASPVEVFHSARRVASHLRSYVRGRHTTDPAHMPVPIAATPNGARRGSSGGRGGPARPPPASPRPFSTRGLIPSRATGPVWASSASPTDGTERVEAACRRALDARALSYRSVESILRHGLDSQPLPEDRPVRVHPRHANLRGASYYR